MLEASLDQKTISILLAGRKLLEDCRTTKQQIRIELEKINYTQMQDALTSIVLQRNLELSKLGFESVEAFTRFNDSMCILALSECVPLISICDKCKGYSDTPPCIVSFNTSSCYNTWNDNTEGKNTFFKYLLWGLRKLTGTIVIPEDLKLHMPKLINTPEFKIGEKISFGVCPEGRGFINEVKSSFPFDIMWRV